MVLVRVRTDAGFDGLGEAVPSRSEATSRCGRSSARSPTQRNRLAGLDLAPATDDPLPFAIAMLIELRTPRRLGGAALAALECALFDVVAKAAGIPMWKLLGALKAEPVTCNATLTAGDPDHVAKQAKDWAAAGFETFKVKLGAGYDDAETVSAVRETVGAGARIRVDSNEAWTAREATEVLRLVEPHDIELAEQPVSGLRGMARVAQDVEIPLAADESVSSEADAHRAVQRRSCAYATAKLSKVGGIGAARQISRVLPTYLSSALDGPVGIAAAAHTAQIVRADGNDPGLAHGLATQRLFSASVASRECELDGDQLHLPDGPGLGVDLDDEALARLALGAG